jgi:mannitol-1-phosphate 5-dehydrogenase
LLERWKLKQGPIDILICENLRDASKIFREGLSKLLPADFPFDSMVGLVETCTGKMVPIMTKEQTEKDPLLIFAEAHNTLIVDKKGFKGTIPKVMNLEAKGNITAYVDRKLFVHNMGHAVIAYLGYVTNPEMKYVWEAIGEKHIRRAVKEAMWESSRALIMEYPEEFNEENMKEYIDDLIRRLSNKALGDTIYRIGRDVPRKLSRNDRLIGPLLLSMKHSISAPYITITAAAATLFRAKDENGEMFEKDRVFAEQIYPRGIDFVIKEICGLDFEREKEIVDNIRDAYSFVIKDPKNWFRWDKLRS